MGCTLTSPARTPPGAVEDAEGLPPLSRRGAHAHYHIDKRKTLGKGSFGTVYRARSRNGDGATWAVKVLSRQKIKAASLVSAGELC